MSEESNRFVETICRIQEIMLKPLNEWGSVASESTSMKELYLGYIAPLAAIGPIASVIGVSFIGISGGTGAMYRLPLLPSFSMELVSYVCTLVGIFLLAALVSLLAPLFGGEGSLTKAMRLISYSYTPAWLAGFLYLAPDFALFAILLSFYSIYVLYVGIPIVLKSSEDPAASAGFAAIITVGAVAVGILSDTIGTQSYGLTIVAFKRQVEQIQQIQRMGFPEVTRPVEGERKPPRTRQPERVKQPERVVQPEPTPPPYRPAPPRRTSPDDNKYEVPELPDEMPPLIRR